MGFPIESKIIRKSEHTKQLLLTPNIKTSTTHTKSIPAEEEYSRDDW